MLSVSVSPYGPCLVDSVGHVLLVSSIPSDSPQFFVPGFLTGLLYFLFSLLCDFVEVTWPLCFIFPMYKMKEWRHHSHAWLPGSHQDLSQAWCAIRRLRLGSLTKEVFAHSLATPLCLENTATHAE